MYILLYTLLTNENILYILHIIQYDNKLLLNYNFNVIQFILIIYFIVSMFLCEGS